MQTVKWILTKAKENNRDPYLAMLEYRNTPTDSNASPTQLLMGRRTRAILPITKSQLRPCTVDPESFHRARELKQQSQKKYYDRGAKELPLMSRGDPVGVQLEKKWTPAVITDVASTPRSFIVQTPSGQLFRRNRKFLLRRDNESQSHLTPETVVSKSEQEPLEDVQDLQSGVQPEKAI